MIRRSREVTKRALAKNVRSARRACGFSLREMAEITGLSRQTVYMVEKAETLPNAYGLYLFAKALGVTMDSLLE